MYLNSQCYLKLIGNTTDLRKSHSKTKKRLRQKTQLNTDFESTISLSLPINLFCRNLQIEQLFGFCQIF